MTGRAQLTDIDETLFGANGITCSIPQGYILGLLLFPLYVNTDKSAAVKCKLLLYVDDSVLLASGKDLEGIEATVSLKLESMNDWLIDTKFSFHLGKMQFIAFGMKRKFVTHS